MRAGCDGGCDWDCDWVFGCVEEAVAGLGFCPPDAVVGGVDMPLGRSAAGDAMFDGVLEEWCVRFMYTYSVVH